MRSPVAASSVEGTTVDSPPRSRRQVHRERRQRRLLLLVGFAALAGLLAVATLVLGTDSAGHGAPGSFGSTAVPSR